MTSDKLLYQIALTRIVGVGDITARHLLQAVGDEELIFKWNRKSLLAIKGINDKMVDAILAPSVLSEAQEEMEFVVNNNIQTYFISEADYPHRLRECADAPILLYYKGNSTLNSTKIISIVGTRTASNYGVSFCDTFLKEIATQYPDTLIVSGLAYGIDIAAHRAALKHNLPTIGVLAHGLDRIYPAVHQQTAKEMQEHGGLLTEFVSKTEPDKFNFVRRNRIVAGMADATIVVESNAKGGSLITAELAGSYCKDVFAVPGRMTDSRSSGCNKLIATHKAELFLSTEHFLEQMGWDDASKKKKAPRQQTLFLELSDDETKILDCLNKNGSVHTDQLATDTHIPVYQLVSLLFEMEMKGLVEAQPGNSYKTK